jgi:hypothetical protein
VKGISILLPFPYFILRSQVTSVMCSFLWSWIKIYASESWLCYAIFLGLQNPVILTCTPLQKCVSKVEHFISGLFGIRNYGVDINGYVMDPEKGLCIWLQRRSATKQTWPGKWDNMVCISSTVFWIKRFTIFGEIYNYIFVQMWRVRNWNIWL